MKNGLALFRRLPVSLAFRFFIFYSFRRLLAIPGNVSFSQTGEDDILFYYLPQCTGTYIDVGAHEPMWLSNTFRFYLKGWNGIAIDANDSLIHRFKRIRRLDLGVVAAVSDREADVVFHRSQQAATSTVDTATFERWKSRWTFRPEDQVTVRTRTLTSILNEHLPNVSGGIDLLNVDVEGHEFQVLSGLDLNKYRPRLIVVEIHDTKSIRTNETYLLLTRQGYELVGYITINAYFADTRTQE